MLVRKAKGEKEHLEAIIAVNLFAARDRRPLVPVGLNFVLDAAADVELPSLQDWFYHEVDAIITEKVNDNNTPRWGSIEASKIVRAAVRQLSIENLGYRVLWERTLEHPLYATSALNAFAIDPKELGQHLGKWWDTNPENREKDLPFFIDLLWELTGETDYFLTTLKYKGSAWTPDLRMAINEQLTRLNIPTAFRPLSTAI